MNEGFSEPVTPTDNTADYAPTQVLAEAFRSHGYDGVIYRSMLGPGKNIAIFDLGNAELVNCTLHRVTTVKFEFSQADNTSYVMKHYPEIQKSLSAASQGEENVLVKVSPELVANDEEDSGS